MPGKGEYMESHIRIGNQWVSLEEARSRRRRNEEIYQQIKAIVGIGIIVLFGGMLLFAV